MDTRPDHSTEFLTDRFAPAVDGAAQRRELLGIGPEAEAWIRHRYEQIYRDDTLDDLVRRARFDRNDAGLLRDWIAAAVRAGFASSKEKQS